MRRILLIGAGLLIIIGFVLVASFGKKTNTCPILQSPVDTTNVTSSSIPANTAVEIIRLTAGFDLTD